MEYLWYFYGYSLLGFLLEVAYARVTRAGKQDRKCRLILPMCPVYGLGVTLILLVGQAVPLNWLGMMAVGSICATLVEYATAVFYEKVWHVSFWDYRQLPGNVQGRVCLPFSLIWGALTPLILLLLHPLVAAVARQLPAVLLLPLSLVYLLDTVLTGHLLRRTESTDVLLWYRPVTLTRERENHRDLPGE